MIRAYAHQGGFGFNLSIAIVYESQDGSGEKRIMRLGEGLGGNMLELVDLTGDVPPTMHLTMEEAFALQDALAELRSGSSELRALRADYDAERKRVDRFIEHLTGGGEGR